MESAGGPLKEMYYSTNRHAADYTLQLGKQFYDSVFLNNVWPHLTPHRPLPLRGPLARRPNGQREPRSCYFEVASAARGAR